MVGWLKYLVQAFYFPLAWKDRARHLKCYTKQRYDTKHHGCNNDSEWQRHKWSWWFRGSISVWATRCGSRRKVCWFVVLFISNYSVANHCLTYFQIFVCRNVVIAPQQVLISHILQKISSSSKVFMANYFTCP